MTAFNCDRCHDYHGGTAPTRIDAEFYGDRDGRNQFINTEPDQFELCDACTIDFKAWLKATAQPAAETFIVNPEPCTADDLELPF